MTEAMYTTVLKKADAKKTKNGALELPEGRTMTLYVAHDGTSMSVARILALKLEEGGVIEARDNKGEIYLLSLEDVFAASIQGGSDNAPVRKAGFRA